MILLAFELATEACSVAVMHDGRLLARHEIAPRRHAELALPWAEALLDEAGLAKSQLDALAVGIGPGAFTGVRLAISLVQGIALGLDRPVLAVSTLAALAEPFLADGPVLSAIDARMGELYIGQFDADAEGLPVPAAPEALVPVADAARHLRATWAGASTASGGSAVTSMALRRETRFGVGTGFAAAGGGWWSSLAEAFARVDADALPNALAVARIAARDWHLGHAIAPDRLEPTYLRDKVALTSAEQAAARAAKAV
ncbi:MAG: tRNA (adenosine(37)-N6)-threonylcarbamoyltransferase complex dimerization subunit type 1 TsaB [Silanimonas sp.]